MGMGRKNDPLTIERARELFDYNKETGIVTRKTNVTYNAKKGDCIGHLCSIGYLHVSVDGVLYLCHRLAFFIVSGFWPKEIDHINGNRSDNRWENIREVTRSINHKNQKLRSSNTSGVMGVTWDKARNKWAARIRVEYRHVALGRFEDWFDAVCARKAADNKYGFHKNHGRAA